MAIWERQHRRNFFVYRWTNFMLVPSEHGQDNENVQLICLKIVETRFHSGFIIAIIPFLPFILILNLSSKPVGCVHNRATDLFTANRTTTTTVWHSFNSFRCYHKRWYFVIFNPSLSFNKSQVANKLNVHLCREMFTYLNRQTDRQTSSQSKIISSKFLFGKCYGIFYIPGLEKNFISI